LRFFLNLGVAMEVDALAEDRYPLGDELAAFEHEGLGEGF
jgi:hypothetical protein